MFLLATTALCARASALSCAHKPMCMCFLRVSIVSASMNDITVVDYTSNDVRGGATASNRAEGEVVEVLPREGKTTSKMIQPLSISQRRRRNGCPKTGGKTGGHNVAAPAATSTSSLSAGVPPSARSLRPITAVRRGRRYVTATAPKEPSRSF
jgi:hypothetical protein